MRHKIAIFLQGCPSGYETMANNANKQRINILVRFKNDIFIYLLLLLLFIYAMQFIFFPKYNKHKKIDIYVNIIKYSDQVH